MKVRAAGSKKVEFFGKLPVVSLELGRVIGVVDLQAKQPSALEIDQGCAFLSTR
jgi:hypothetical protein